MHRRHAGVPKGIRDCITVFQGSFWDTVYDVLSLLLRWSELQLVWGLVLHL